MDGRITNNFNQGPRKDTNTNLIQIPLDDNASEMNEPMKNGKEMDWISTMGAEEALANLHRLNNKLMEDTSYLQITMQQYEYHKMRSCEKHLEGAPIGTAMFFENQSYNWKELCRAEQDRITNGMPDFYMKQRFVYNGQPTDMHGKFSFCEPIFSHPQAKIIISSYTTTVQLMLDFTTCFLPPIINDVGEFYRIMLSTNIMRNYPFIQLRFSEHEAKALGMLLGKGNSSLMFSGTQACVILAYLKGEYGEQWEKHAKISCSLMIDESHPSFTAMGFKKNEILSLDGNSHLFDCSRIISRDLRPENYTRGELYARMSKHDVKFTHIGYNSVLQRDANLNRLTFVGESEVECESLFKALNKAGGVVHMKSVKPSAKNLKEWIEGVVRDIQQSKDGDENSLKICTVKRFDTETPIDTPDSHKSPGVFISYMGVQQHDRGYQARLLDKCPFYHREGVENPAKTSSVHNHLIPLFLLDD